MKPIICAMQRWSTGSQIRSAFADWTLGWVTLGSPSPQPSPEGRGSMVHCLSITRMPEFAQQPSAKHQIDACGSLSLPPSRRSGAFPPSPSASARSRRSVAETEARREGGRERARVRGKCSVEQSKRSLSQGLRRNLRHPSLSFYATRRRHS